MPMVRQLTSDAPNVFDQVPLVPLAGSNFIPRVLGHDCGIIANDYCIH